MTKAMDYSLVAVVTVILQQGVLRLVVFDQ